MGCASRLSVYKLINDVLTPLNIPLASISFVGDADDYIVYSIIDSPNTTVADGKVTGVSTRVQVDFNTKTNSKIPIVAEQIENLLIDAGFMRVGDRKDAYDPSSKYFYCHQDFRYYERKDK